MRLPRLLLAPLALLAAGCGASDPYAGPPEETSGLEWTLEPGSFYEPTFEWPKPAHVRATVAVLSGGPIDAFLAAGASCAEYPTGAFEPAASLLGSANGTFEADLPAGQACLVLDNHDAPVGTAPGNGTVRVSYRIDLWSR